MKNKLLVNPEKNISHVSSLLCPEDRWVRQVNTTLCHCAQTSTNFLDSTECPLRDQKTQEQANLVWPQQRTVLAVKQPLVQCEPSGSYNHCSHHTWPECSDASLNSECTSYFSSEELTFISIYMCSLEWVDFTKQNRNTLSLVPLNN